MSSVRRSPRRAAHACLGAALTLSACFHDDGKADDAASASTSTTGPSTSATSTPDTEPLSAAASDPATDTDPSTTSDTSLTPTTPLTSTSEPLTTGCTEQLWYLDEDGDGYGVADDTILACDLPPGYAALAGDCGPDDDVVSPGQFELCDGKDNDCDLGVDEYSPGNVACDDCRSYVWEAGQRVFYLCSRQADWIAARLACQAYGTGHSLAVFHDAAEQAAVVEQLAAVPAEANAPWWIGLGDAVSEGIFVWVDGTPVDFTAWNPGEPNNLGEEDCVQFPGGSLGLWNDLTCDTSMFYICEGPQ